MATTDDRENMTPADQEWFEERASIREYDGGMDRDAAELMAAVDLKKERKRDGRTG
jgi:hypothetical protein